MPGVFQRGDERVVASRIRAFISFREAGGKIVEGEPGDWLITSPGGSMTVTTDNHFRAKYTPVDSGAQEELDAPLDPDDFTYPYFEREDWVSDE